MLRFGVERSDHWLPFHLSAKGTVSPVDLLNWPTATHEFDDMQATPCKMLAARVGLGPVGFGVGWTDHWLPFHLSARLSDWKDPCEVL